MHSRWLRFLCSIVFAAITIRPVMAAAQGCVTFLRTDFAAAGGPDSAALADFNGDGKLDLAVGNNFSTNVSILLGTGTGSFGAPTNFGTYGYPQSVAVGDFNRDAKLDLAVASGTGAVTVLLGNGAGGFGGTGPVTVGMNPISVAVGDFDEDGDPDLAVANYDGTVSILLGTGFGSFSPATSFATQGASNSVALGDFNGDGHRDLAVANRGIASVSILLGTGTGSFGAPTHFAAGAGTWSVAVGDLNGDGKPDVVTANINAGNASVLLNTYPACPAYYTMVPCRVADTRSPNGPSGGPSLGGNTTRAFPLTGTCGIPSAAVAVSVNATAVQAAATGYLTLYQGKAAVAPLASNVNFSAGQTRGNNAMLLLGTDGTIKVKNGSSGVVHFVLDVNGFFQ